VYRILLLLLVSLSAFSQNSKEEFNQLDENGKKQGTWHKYHPGDSILRYEGQFRDDQPYGKFTHFFIDGKVKVVLTYSSPDRAFARNYYPDGTLMAVGAYENQQKDSTWVYYDFYGSKISEENYITGKRYGYWRKYFPNGKLMQEIYYENDLETGTIKQYFSTGILYREAIYFEGGLEGDAAFYHENGILHHEGKYHRDAKTGIWKSYDEDGQLIDERKYVKGVPEFRESDLIHEDSSKYYVKDVFTIEDVFEEDFMVVPSKEEDKKKKKTKK